jgi:hypothetical protein
VDRASAALAARADNAVGSVRLWWLRLARLDRRGACRSSSPTPSLAVDDLARCRVLLAEADDAAFESLRSAAAVPDRLQHGCSACSDCIR